MASLNKTGGFLHPDLINGKIFTSLFAFAIPILVSFIFQQLYNAVDTIIVGHYLKESSLAAVGSSAVLFELIVGFGNGFGSGMSIVVARAYGANKQEYLKKLVAASILLTLAVTLALILLSAVFLKKSLILLGTPENLLEESFSYIVVISMGCGVLFAYNLLSGLLRAIGNSFVPLLFLIFSSLLNIVLDIVLITHFNMGIRGAAIATVIAQLVSAVLCLAYIFLHARILIPQSKHFSLEFQYFKELMGQGFSMAFMGSIVSSGTVVLQSAINSFGTLIIAGHIATRKLFCIITIPIISFAISASTFVSQNYGAGRLDRAKKGVKMANLITIIWTFFLAATMFFFVTPAIRFISGSSLSEIVNYGRNYIYFSVPFMIALGPLVVIRTCMQGLGSKILPLVSSIIELCGKILFTAWVIPVLGIWGIIICEPLIWCVMFMHLAYAYHKTIRQLESKN